MKTKKKAAKKEELLCVEVLEAKPNSLFSEVERSWIRFLRYNRSVACTECGKRRRVMWTMLCEFYAYDMNAHGFALVTPEKKHPPLEPVCGEHPLAPAWPKKAAKTKEGR